MITEKVIKTILKERSDRIEFLINMGQFEDAICIGEEFDEWIRKLMVD